MDVYRKLQIHLDNMPVGFPATKSGVEIRLLKHLFSEEEAEIAFHISAIPEPINKIYKRIKNPDISIQRLGEMLENLSRKGAIIKKKHQVKGVVIELYGKIPLAIGMFEFQVDRLTKDFAKDFYSYEDEAFAEELLSNKTQQMRTIPLNATIQPQFIVGNYDNATDLIKNSKGPFALMNCVCRQAKDLLGEPCKQTELRDTCITLESAAKHMIERGVAHELSKKGTLKLLTRAKKEGMVLQPENTQHPNFICCCCGCCCGVLHAAKKYDKPSEFLHSNYYAEINGVICEACGDCVDRCQLDAISQKDNYMLVNRDKCIGCGVCVPVCSTKAIGLFTKEMKTIPPKGKGEMYRKMILERYGVVGTARLMGKVLLGQKI